MLETNNFLKLKTIQLIGGPTYFKYFSTLLVLFDYKNQRAYLAIPVGDIKGLIIIKND